MYSTVPLTVLRYDTVESNLRLRVQLTRRITAHHVLYGNIRQLLRI